MEEKASKQFCIKCGSEIPVGSEFCPKCGAPQTQTASTDSNSQPAKQKYEVSNWHWFLIVVGWICALMGFASGYYANAVLIGLAIGVYVDTHDDTKYGKYLWITALIIFALQIIQGFMTGFNSARY